MIDELGNLKKYDSEIGRIEDSIGDIFIHLDAAIESCERKGNPQLKYRKNEGTTDMLRYLGSIKGEFESESSFGHILENIGMIESLVRNSSMKSASYIPPALRTIS
ncbi:MAG: hypothetical protein JW789_01395 [Candidatus Aenigmarchaeota archaeon]|nr:hypothetical protein [Candidatus Aenigmarchaeota archaeon]